MSIYGIVVASLLAQGGVNEAEPVQIRLEPYAAGRLAVSQRITLVPDTIYSVRPPCTVGVLTIVSDERLLLATRSCETAYFKTDSLESYFVEVKPLDQPMRRAVQVSLFPARPIQNRWLYVDEPNETLESATPLPAGETAIEGAISQNDVDVYRLPIEYQEGRIDFSRERDLDFIRVEVLLSRNAEDPVDDAFVIESLNPSLFGQPTVNLINVKHVYIRIKHVESDSALIRKYRLTWSLDYKEAGTDSSLFDAQASERNAPFWFPGASASLSASQQDIGLSLGSQIVWATARYQDRVASYLALSARAGVSGHVDFLGRGFGIGVQPEVDLTLGGGVFGFTLGFYLDAAADLRSIQLTTQHDLGSGVSVGGLIPFCESCHAGLLLQARAGWKVIQNIGDTIWGLRPGDVISSYGANASVIHSNWLLSLDYRMGYLTGYPDGSGNAQVDDVVHTLEFELMETLLFRRSDLPAATELRGKLRFSEAGFFPFEFSVSLALSLHLFDLLYG